MQLNFLVNFFREYTYLYGAILFGIPFLILYLYKKDSRSGMIHVGLMTGLAAFIFSHISIADYWHPKFLIPNVPLEDFIYGFFFGGFVSECADIFIKHKFKKVKSRKIFLYSLFFISPIITFVFINIFQLNSILVLFLLTLIISIASIFFNYKIIYLQFLSGLVGLFVTFIVFKLLLLINPLFIVENWSLEKISGILISGIPLEEYLFAFMLGFCITHFYEMISGKDVKF